jgi:hypothetical protein
MLSNGNQYFSQGFQYPQQGLTPPQLGLLGMGAPQFGPQGVPGAGAYSGGWSPEAHQQGSGFAQQIPFGNSFAATSGQAGLGPQLIWALSQLAQQVATQGIVAQQLGAVLSQLTQQLAPQALQSFGAQGYGGQPGNFGGFAASPTFNSPAFNIGGAGVQGFGAQGLSTAPGQNPFVGQQGFAGFAPQIPGWAIHRPAMA